VDNLAIFWKNSRPNINFNLSSYRESTVKPSSVFTKGFRVNIMKLTSFQKILTTGIKIRGEFLYGISYSIPTF